MSQMQRIELAQGDVCWICCCAEGAAPVIVSAILHMSSACDSDGLCKSLVFQQILQGRERSKPSLRHLCR